MNTSQVQNPWFKKLGQVWTLAALALVTGCALNAGNEGEGADSDGTLGKVSQGVVYGIDDRQDVGAHSDASLRRLAEASSFTTMPAATLNTSNPSNVTFNPVATSLQTLRNMCTNQNQRFLADPVAGECSGTLIDDNLAITAGHCITAAACSTTRFVFNYQRDASGALRTITTDDIFSCASVVQDVESGGLDYAIVRLDRSARPRFTPAVVRNNRAPLAQGTRVGMIGGPDRTPVKIDSGGMVLTPRTGTDFFNATVDSFGGNSGSGIFELGSYQMVGVLQGGNPDYVRGPVGSTPANCQIVNNCAEGGCFGGTGSTSPGAGTGSEQITYIGPILASFCASNPGNTRLCGRQNSFSYSASNTAGGTQNTVDQYVFLEPGATLDFGTCGTPGATGTGDTLLTLVAPNGAVVASNDDGGGTCNVLSHTTFTAPPFLGGLYQMKGGCYSTGACTGAVTYTVSGPSGGSFSYSATGTTNATTNSRDVVLNVQQGSVITAGTCSPTALNAAPPVSLERTAFTGNTFLRLLSGTTVLASNDNACGGLGSQLTFTATSTGPLTLRAGCSGATSCTGNVSYTINSDAFAYSVSATTSATVNTVNRNVQLGAGDQITVGTCGMLGSTFTGDTFLRLFSGATELTSNDDACNGAGSLLTFKAATAGTYQVRAGCFSAGACTGTPVIRVVRAANIRTGTGAYSYFVSATASATRSTGNQPLLLRAGETVLLGTCPSVPGGIGLGDTYLRLFGPNSAEIAGNDDNCGTPGGNLFSSISFTVPVGQEGSYEIRGGCFGDNTCTGTVGYVNQ